MTICKKRLFQIWTIEKRKNAWSLVKNPESFKNVLMSAIKLIIAQ